MDAPCTHFFRESGDEVTCLLCSRYPDDERNGYVKKEQSKDHKNWHNYHGPSANKRGNFFRGGRSQIKSLPDDILFNTPVSALAILYGVTRSPIDKEKVRRRRKNVV